MLGKWIIICTNVLKIFYCFHVSLIIVIEVQCRFYNVKNSIYLNSLDLINPAAYLQFKMDNCG